MDIPATIDATIELEKYILLVKKTGGNSESHHKVMIAGLEAILNCLKSETDIDEVINELYQHLDNQKKNLDEYIDLTKKLEELNAPVTASEIQYVIAGVDSFKDSQEFIAANNNSGFDFFKLFKVFAKFSADAAHLSACNEQEIDSKYPGLSEDMDLSTVDGKKISHKYKFLAKFFKILAQILIMRAYIMNAITGTSKVLGDKINKMYRSEFSSLKALQKSVDKAIKDISESIKEIEGKANGILSAEYKKLVESRQELQDIYNKLEYQVKIEIVSEALHHKQEVFAPILDPKNKEIFSKLPETDTNHKQDSFSGLTGILNTRPDLSPLRNVMKEVFNNSVNDVIIIAVFAACLAISKETSRDRSHTSFEERFVSQREKHHSVEIGATA